MPRIAKGGTLCLPNELLSELVDWVPMKYFSHDNFEGQQQQHLLDNHQSYGVQLDVYFGRARQKYAQAAEKVGKKFKGYG